MFTDDIVRALLVVGRQVAVSVVVAGQALAAGDPGAFENHEREAWKRTHVDLVGTSTGGSADRFVVRKFNVWQGDVPVVLSFVDDHHQHLSHGAVDALDATVTVGVTGARRDFSHAEELVHGKRQLGAEL